MARRTKQQLMPHVPELIYDDIFVELTDEHAKQYAAAAKDIAKFMAERAAQDARSQGKNADRAAAAEERRVRKAEDLHRLNQLRQIASRGKLAEVVQWVHSFMADPDGVLDDDLNRPAYPAKLIVFAYYQETQQALRDALASYGVVTLFGGQSVKETEAAKAAFQDTSPGSPRVAVCSVVSAKESHTLTAAYDTLLVEEPPVAGWIHQLAGRSHARADNPHGIVLHTVIAKGTVDERLHDFAKGKEAASTAVLDTGTYTETMSEDEVVATLLDEVARTAG
jgi:hypothetical protein